MVAFRDLGGYPREKFGLKSGYQAIRQCLVDWNDRWAFIFENLYQPWPSTYGSVNAYCIDAEDEPFPGSAVADLGTGYVSYEKALVTLHYTTNVFEYSSGVTGFESLRGYADRNAISKTAGLRWGSVNGDAVLDGQAPPYDCPGMVYIRGYMGVSSIPNAVTTCFGAVNNAPITSYTLGKTFATETLKFADYQAERQINAAGGLAWKLVYSFNWKPNFDTNGNQCGWNYFWRPQINNFQHIVLADGTQYKPNRPVNMLALFP